MKTIPATNKRKKKGSWSATKKNLRQRDKSWGQRHPRTCQVIPGKVATTEPLKMVPLNLIPKIKVGHILSFPIFLFLSSSRCNSSKVAKVHPLCGKSQKAVHLSARPTHTVSSLWDWDSENPHGVMASGPDRGKLSTFKLWHSVSKRHSATMVHLVMEKLKPSIVRWTGFLSGTWGPNSLD